MIALHGGCGRVSKKKMVELEELMSSIAEESVKKFNQDCDSLDVCEDAVVALENSGLVNAGQGASLTQKGGVENEASIMCGSSGLFGGVSCVETFPNPVAIARQLISHQKTLENKLLVTPQYLVGNGVNEFIEEVASLKNLSRMHQIKPSKSSQAELRRLKQIIKIDMNQCERMDTVGVVCLDVRGNIAVGASSGGMVLKRPGRVGHVALPSGSGIWSVENSIACCVTGCGEKLAHLNLARSVVEHISNTTTDVSDHYNPLGIKLHNYLTNVFNKQQEANVAGVVPKEMFYVGALAVNKDRNSERVEVAWIHSTHSMPVCVMSVDWSLPKFFKNINSCDCIGKTLVVQEICV